MSDYLQNLIARVSQRAPVLQRRRPALFEPVAPWARPPVQGGDDSIENGSTEPVPRPAEEPQRDTDAAPPPATGQDPFSSRDAPNDMPRAAAFSRSADMRPAEPASPPVMRPDSLRPSMEEPTIPTDGARRDRPAMPIVERHAKVPAGQETTIPAAPARPSRLTEDIEAPPGERSSPSPQSATAGNIAASVSKHNERRNDGMANNLLVPRAPAIAQAIQLAKASPAQTALKTLTGSPAERDSVQISIGRVEVRAITDKEQEKGRAAKPKAPRLTLEDYLRERRGGRR